MPLQLCKAYMVAEGRLSMSEKEKSGVEQTAAMRELLSILDLENLEVDLSGATVHRSAGSGCSAGRSSGRR